MFSSNNYGYDFPPFMAGQVSDLFDRYTDTVPALIEIRFGVVLVDSQTNPGFVELPSPENLRFSGIAQHEHIDPAIAGGKIIFPPKYPIPRLRRGRVAAQIDDDLLSVNKFEQVFVRVSAEGDLKQPGQLRKNDSGGSVLWTNAYWTGRIIPGKLAEVGINLA